MAQLVDLVVAAGVLLDVGVAAGQVRLGLVVVEVADEVLDRVVWEEVPELAVQLRRQRLIVRQHERRLPHLLDRLRDRVGVVNDQPSETAEERLGTSYRQVVHVVALRLDPFDVCHCGPPAGQQPLQGVDGLDVPGDAGGVAFSGKLLQGSHDRLGRRAPEAASVVLEHVEASARQARQFSDLPLVGAHGEARLPEQSAGIRQRIGVAAHD